MAKSFSRPTYAEISAVNFKENYHYLSKLDGSPFFCPMLKSNAYGHDITKILPLCKNLHTDWVGVATIDEAIEVRSGGFKNNILVFAPDYKNTNDLLHKFGLIPVISDLRHLEQIKNIKAHLKINTGMNRMGIRPDEIEKSIVSIGKQKIQIEGVLSHFLNGSDFNQVDGFSKKQYDEFNKACSHKELQNIKYKHIYNSYALLNKKEQDGIGARPGISLFGYADSENENLKPVMRLKTKVIKLNWVKKGEAVSYGPSWSAKKDTLVGVLPIGYGDGLHRALSNQVEFICRGKPTKQIGTICMDYTMVDLTDLQNEVDIYDDVFLFGNKQKELQFFAEKLNTITYDLLTGITDRVPRVMVENFS